MNRFPYNLWHSEFAIDRQIEREERRAEYLRDTEILEPTNTRNELTRHIKDTSNRAIEGDSNRAS